ncbi:protein adenylyltransferase SelO [Hydrogenophaga sp. OTU3427]|uniref:protein adenylyltransferase SelO n=1 Tax=Hydrogenophaga sp. OTU3427 TaxID=3043856 RepID=UPI00313E4820
MTLATPLDAPTRWASRFAALGPAFGTALPPTPLPAPYWVGRNPALAQGLGLNPDWMDSDEALSVFTGNHVPDGARPMASVYSGHQFGVWAGQLGDGRALLLGEWDTPLGPQEVQLKGAGRTPYSRMGDGRAVLRSSIREFLCSEAMHALGVPTTRALCVTGSDAPVRRETMETAAVVTRVAPSFIRFGHFEHFSHHDQHAELRRLADFVIEHFYPECAQAQGNPYAALLQAVSERTAVLLSHWQAVGFCHGVMNTDNMSILGLTIDYGPFQFLDAYVPGHICNHSDSSGRYAYSRQPNIAYWNLFCLGQALLPLMDEQQQALDALESYKAVYPEQLFARLGAKLGLAEVTPGDRELCENLLRLLAQDKVDHTHFWRRLSHAVARGDFEPVRDLFLDRPALDTWLAGYRERIGGQSAEPTGTRMLQTNPKFVLRNHLGELAIRAAQAKDFSAVSTLFTLISQPFDEHPGHEEQAGFPPDWASQIEISCSS